MFRVRWHRLLSPFPRKTTSVVDHISKRLQSNQKPSENESFWSHLFGKYLFVTNTVGSGLLLGIGDLIVQYCDRLTEKKSFDYIRSRNMVVTGLIMGPVQHGFYSLLDRVFIGKTRLVILQKLLADQLIMSPSYITLFFTITSLLEGLSIKECHAILSKNFLYTWALDCCIFAALQYLIFRYLTAMYRVVFINLVNCLYIVMLSYIKHSP
ncbi:mpv17-like protein 2 [Drosophila serrata]|uniref:mpv17-like protein 2 n=1 Tax=Drosophila serrata TaxID=7274 RepID=UPI000A1D2861|nr:mpv17-like protein 2 [Drosophila serrata]KAH8355772.1 hypothetical protein KR200_002143 [Drosophila serrata]